MDALVRNDELPLRLCSSGGRHGGASDHGKINIPTQHFCVYGLYQPRRLKRSSTYIAVLVQLF
jgi:hypothetical protein